MAYKLGSLFDGSGGFPLAGSLCGIEPVWAAEVEPYPIAVTRSRFPSMRHLGDISKVDGSKIEPVDIITFGSPCQDLSVAGKRAGLKHEANGDDETTRSGLFMEAVRIIKEMREATNGVYPRFAFWENVPGAFSSNKGEDFRIVLEELIKVAEPTAVMPEVPKNGWPYADSYCGDGWSIAYRVLDAQFWGVPQRRRRIYLVADFRGECAGKVSFEREGLRGYFKTGRTPRQTTPGDAESSTGATARERNALAYTLKIRSGCEGGGKGALIQTDMSATLSTLNDQYLFQPVVYGIGSYHSNAMKSDNPHSGIYEASTSKTLDALNCGYPGCNQGGMAVVQPIQTYQKVTDPLMANSHPGSYTGQDAFSDMLVAGVDARNATEYPELTGALQADAAHNLNSNNVVRVQYIVRRLTPTECARLQGFPDTWGHPDEKTEFTDEEYQFWLNVRNTHAAINDKATKDYTKEQMLKWYNGLHTDSAEYKMWGNGIALPPALYCMQGIVDVLERDDDAWLP